MKYTLSFFLEGEEYQFNLDQQEVTIGKLETNTLKLEDTAVSRTHCKIVKSPEGFTITDFQSTNGTFVNGVKVKNHKLNAGDKITVGQTNLNFRVWPSTFLKEENHEISVSLPLHGTPESSPTNQPEASKLTKYLSNSHLFFQNLSETSEIPQVFKETGDFIRELLQVKRILIFSCSGEDRKLCLEYSGSSEGRKPDKLQISATIANKALNEKMAIISSNTQEDSRFSKARSIILQGIKSAICVPLWTKDSIKGLIYCDTDDFGNMFTENDLIILRNIANFTGITLENIRNMMLINEERLLRSRLERYHSPAVVSRIMEQSDNKSIGIAGYRELDATVMFMDIAGFTSIVEHLSPIQTGKFLNRVFGEMTEIIFKYKGTLDKYTGDGIMAVFGAPFQFSTHSKNAVQAAIEMQEVIQNFKHTPHPLKIRIGIASGTIVDGDFGSIRRHDYTVLGNTVNIASRLESSVAEPGQILISESTYKLVQRDFTCTPLGPKTLRGISRKENPYIVSSEKEIE